MADSKKTPVPGIIWVFLVLGVLAVGFVGYLWVMPRPTYTTEDVVVEEASETHEEILERLKKYVHSPGPEYAFERPAEIRAAGVFPPLGRPMEVGESRAATPVEPSSGAIQDALENLEPGASMTWSWGPKREPDAWHGPSAWRDIRVTRRDDGLCHVRVADIKQERVE